MLSTCYVSTIYKHIYAHCLDLVRLLRVKEDAGKCEESPSSVWSWRWICATLAILVSILLNWFLKICFLLGGVHHSPPPPPPSSRSILMYLNKVTLLCSQQKLTNILVRRRRLIWSPGLNRLFHIKKTLLVLFETMMGNSMGQVFCWDPLLYATRKLSC